MGVFKSSALSTFGPSGTERVSVRRRLGTWAWIGASYGASFGILFLLALLVVHITVKSLPAWHWTVLFTTTNGIAGGLANAILGTAWIGFWTLILAFPLGLGAATYLNEYANPRFRDRVLVVSDVLAGIPSIVVGYVGYMAFVLNFGWGFSTLAAALTLTIVVLPYMLRNIFTALTEVPQAQREAGLAIGLSLARTVWTIVWPGARRGILTGVLISLGVAMGETAPLLYTADWSNNLPALSLVHHSVGYLTYVVWTYIQEPYPSAIALAYLSGLILMAGIFLVTLGVALVQRHIQLDGR